MATTANTNPIKEDKEYYLTLIEFQYEPLPMMLTAVTDNIANLRGLSKQN